MEMRRQGEAFITILQQINTAKQIKERTIFIAANFDKTKYYVSLRHDKDFKIGFGVLNNLCFRYRLSIRSLSDSSFRE